ncbi:DNA-binding protein [Microbacterium maritypicum]
MPTRDSIHSFRKDAAKLFCDGYRRIKLGIENRTIPTVDFGPHPMVPPVPVLRVFDINA